MSKKENKNELLKEAEDRLNKVMSIVILSDTEGGKALVALLLKQVVSNIETLMVGYQKLSINEFISLSADMRTKMDLVHEIIGAKSKELMIKEEIKYQLEQALLNE